MKIQTKFLGEVTIDPTTIIEFPQGIPAFEDEKQFVLIPLAEKSPFIILQSVNTQSVGFMAAYPFDFKKDYAFDLEKVDEEKLEIDESDEVLVYSLLTLKDSLENSTMNLLAPIVINAQKKLGQQIVLSESAHHPLRYPLRSKEGSVR
ncbi:MAG: flagellar assembly protein FliW [Kurthia sp.]|nr:flagellar assembly protein FliW [Candidatus Kurthia equi]